MEITRLLNTSSLCLFFGRYRISLNVLFIYISRGSKYIKYLYIANRTDYNTVQLNAHGFLIIHIHNGIDLLPVICDGSCGIFVYNALRRVILYPLYLGFRLKADLRWRKSPLPLMRLNTLS